MNKLADLKAVEVSVVPRGANKQEFLVVKEDVGMADPTKLEQVLKEAGLDGKLTEKVLKAMEPMLKELSDKGKAAVQAALKILTSVKDELPPDLLQEIMVETGLAPAPVAPVAQEAPVAADTAPVQKEDGSWDFSKVPEAARATVQAIWKEKTESAAKLAKVEKQLADERDVRITKEFNDKAAGFKHLGLKTEELASVMKEVSEKAPKAFEKIESIFKSVDEKVAKSGLFREIGSDAPGGTVNVKPGQTEAEAKIEAIAKGLVEKDSKMTATAAKAKAWEMNPALYAEHRAEAERRQRA